MRLPLLIILASTGCVLGPERSERDALTFDQPVDEVWIDLDAGDLRIEVTDVQSVEIERVWRWRGTSPSVRAEVVDGLLELAVDCEQCSVDHVVRLPRSAAISAMVGAGDIELVGLDDPVDAHSGAGGVVGRHLGADTRMTSGAGDVEAIDVQGDLYAESSAGSIRATGLDARLVIARSGAGDVRVQLDRVPQHAEATTAAGDVWMDVPAGTYALQAGSDAGNVTIDGVQDDAGAGSVLIAESDAGDVHIVGY